MVAQLKGRIEVDELTKNNFKQFQMIIKSCSSVLEEVKSEETVKSWIDTGAKLGYFNDICVGGIAWKQHGETVNILILAVLPAYQSLGLGKSLVLDLIESRRAFKPSLLETKPMRIAVHSPQQTLAFFEKLGFVKESDKILESPHPWIVEKGYKLILNL